MMSLSRNLMYEVVSSSQDQTNDVQSKLEAAYRQYSHGDNLKYIQDQMPAVLYRDNSDDYEGLMTTIGSILRRGDHTTKRMLIRSLRRFGGEQSGELIPEEPAVPNEGVSRTEPLTRTSETMDFGRYVAKLKEHADSLGVEFATTVEEITIRPPLYEATVHLRKERFTARAKSKKEARQQAAYKGCKGLRIG